MEVDIAANRSTKKYSKKEYLLRILWSLCICFFKLTPRNSFEIRNLLLRMFGACIGKNVHIYRSAIIYYPWKLTVGDYSSIGEWALIYNLGAVSIGKKSTVSHRAHLCAGTHDYTKVDLPLIKSTIHIGDQVWICTDAFIGPGISIGSGSVVGARSVVVKDVQQWSIVAGNPSKFIRRRELNSDHG